MKTQKPQKGKTKKRFLQKDLSFVSSASIWSFVSGSIASKLLTQ
jgi:hypothetical protein